MNTLLKVTGLYKHFPVSQASPATRLLARLHGHPAPLPEWLYAVDDVNLYIAAGESVGLVGESGCGKSTLVRLITRLLDPSAGRIVFAGGDIGAVVARDFARRPERAQIQMVFQDPTDSLNPRYTAYKAIAEPLQLLGGITTRTALRVRVAGLAAQVGLAPELLTRFPHQLSGGQKARVGIARAIALKPRLLVLDEPTAALDVSVQAIILHLLARLKAELDISYLFVSHDLNVVRLLCDRVLVMYLGRIIESGPAEAVFRRPLHPYTRALISAIPHSGVPGPARALLTGEPLSPINPDPRVCRFYGRCPKGTTACRTAMPLLTEFDPGHQAACHFPERAVPPVERLPQRSSSGTAPSAQAL